jgi:hypothetical protein
VGHEPHSKDAKNRMQYTVMEQIKSADMISCSAEGKKSPCVFRLEVSHGIDRCYVRTPLGVKFHDTYWERGI